jgi:hypothetical protein
MIEALQALPSAGLDRALISGLLVERLADLKAFEFPRFAGALEDGIGYPLDPRPQARRRAQAGPSSGPAITALASQTRTDGHGWRGVAPSCGDGHG